MRLIDLQKRYLASRITIVPKILDLYPAKSAWSVMKLSSTYSGFCARIKRLSDSATLDLGFDGDVIDVASAQSFIGSGTGLIDRVYDQTGNGYNLNVSLLNRELVFIENGVLKTSYNNLPSFYSPDPTTGFQGLSKADFNFLHQAQASFSIVKDMGVGVLFDSMDATSGALTRVGFNLSGGGFEVGNGSGTDYVIDYGGSLDLAKHIYADYDCTESIPQNRSVLFLDSTQQPDNSAFGSPSVSPSFRDFMVIGRRDGDSSAPVGHLQELIIWDSRQSSNRTAIRQNVNTRFNLY